MQPEELGVDFSLKG